MKHAFIHGIGLAAPGLADWQTAQSVLRGDAAYQAEPLPRFSTTLLPRNEARRAGSAMRLAFRVAEQACNGHNASRCAAVFASSAGDIDIADNLCTAVNTPGAAVSPTRFHNSVHNAAAGYWSIATGSREPANSLSGGMDGFSIALCEAWATLATSTRPVLLVCFDCDSAGLLHDARPDIFGSFALSLLISTQSDGALARLSAPVPTQQPATTLADPGLEQFRRSNPAARGLPLLAKAAVTGSHHVIIESGQDNLAIDIDSSA